MAGCAISISCSGLEKFADDADFQENRWRAVKQANKTQLAAWLAQTHGLVADPKALFDCQCKRNHEYKRQHLNLLHIVALYARAKRGEDIGAPRTFVFAGKAAPANRAAKLIIRFATAVAETIAADPRVRDRLRVVFSPDFNVKNAQRIYPAADLSEQISTAGLEASGTGNMKFTLNGALTIGTLDGANVEIREAVGADEFFLFGLTADEVAARKAAGYHPGVPIAADDELAHVLHLISDGAFSKGDRELFAPLVSDLRERDPFLVCADFRAYADAQARVSEAWAHPAAWTRSSILNTARAGKFSSDRAIRESTPRGSGSLRSRTRRSDRNEPPGRQRGCERSHSLASWRLAVSFVFVLRLRSRALRQRVPVETAGGRSGSRCARAPSAPRSRDRAGADGRDEVVDEMPRDMRDLVDGALERPARSAATASRSRSACARIAAKPRGSRHRWPAARS